MSTRSILPLLFILGIALSALNLRAADVPFITSQTVTAGAVNNFTGETGGRFYNATGTNVTITQLGRWVNPGNNQTHTLTLYEDFGTVRGSVTINCAGATPGQFLYGTLSTPAVVGPGYYYILSTETAGGDTWNNGFGGQTATYTDIGFFETGTFNASIPSLQSNGGVGLSNGPVSFKYSSPLPTWTKTGTTYTTDGSQYQVYSAINNASAGDTVLIPAGTFNWGGAKTSTVLNKPITLAGAGASLTTIVINTTGPTGFGPGLFVFQAAATVRSLTISNNTTSNTTPFVANSHNGWRVSGVTYIPNGSDASIAFLTNVSHALFDNCNITGGTGNCELIFARGPTDAWQTAAGFGDSNAIYVENCTFNGPGYVCDANSNSRMVVRYNTITGPMKIDGHGVASNSPPRSVRRMEVYGNRWTLTTGPWAAIEMRGGPAMIFDNVADAPATSSAWFFLTDYGYISSWPNFGNVYQTPLNYPIKDQIGVGMDPKVAGSEPLYLWNNLRNGAPWNRELKAVAAEAIALYGSPFTERDMIKADRDFFADSGFDGTFAFNGSGGVGRGTKAQMLAITPTKTGVGFWVTNEGSWNVNLPANASGQLYTWNGTAWGLKYTPYTYPHPLRIPSAPSNLRTNP